MANYVAQHDRWLTLGLLLQYHCFLRPAELRRLRFKMLDLKQGLIYLKGDVTKNGEDDIVTIPNSLLKFLREFGLGKYNENWLIFGEGGEPHPDKCCGHDALNSRHKTILQRLKKQGVLSDIKGLSFYSWKDTGALALFKAKVNPLEIMRQLRHKSLSTTQMYCQSLYAVNKEIKTLDNWLISEPMPIG